jgi:hypothetical protein
MQETYPFHDMLRQMDDRLLMEIGPWLDDKRITVGFEVPKCSVDEFRERLEEEIISIARSGVMDNYELNMDGQAIKIHFFKDKFAEQRGHHYMVTGIIAPRLFVNKSWRLCKLPRQLDTRS